MSELVRGRYVASDGVAVLSASLTFPIVPMAAHRNEELRRLYLFDLATDAGIDAVHILGADASQRMLRKGQIISPELAPFLPLIYCQTDAKGTLRWAEDCPAPLLHFSPYDVRLAVVARKHFHLMFATGRCWVDESGCIRFHESVLKGGDELAAKWEGQPLRRPTDPNNLRTKLLVRLTVLAFSVSLSVCLSCLLASFPAPPTHSLTQCLVVTGGRQELFTHPEVKCGALASFDVHSSWSGRIEDEQKAEFRRLIDAKSWCAGI
jgi:hypothetical protein